MRRFEEQCAVISGASGAIGSSVARLLAAEGCDLVLTGRSEGTLEGLAEEISQEGLSPGIVVGDLSEAETSQEIREVTERRGGATLAVHSVGLFVGGSLAESSVADLDRQFAVNVRAPWLLNQALLSQLLRSKGQVVFVNSNAGLDAAAGVGAYAASKHALRALADSFRAEVNSDGVRVLTIYPGRTASQMQEAVCAYFGQTYDPTIFIQPDDVGRTIVEALALARTAEITEVRMRPMVKL